MEKHPAEKPPAEKIVTFDEHLWPINVALLVLAGFVAGGIIALSRFDDDRFLYNGYFRLASLATSAGFLIWLASRLDSHLIRRGLQLAAVLSLLVHVVMMIVLYQQRSALIAQQRDRDHEAIVTRLNADPVTLPDYFLQAPEDQQVPDHERPLEVEVETPEEPTTEIAREEMPEQPEIAPKASASEPAPVPGPTPNVQPSTVQRAQTSEAVPRRSEQTSKFSRQPIKGTLLKSEAISAPQTAAASDQARTQLESQVKAVERRSAAPGVVVDAKSPTIDRVPVIQQQTTQLARREAPQPVLTQQPAVPTLDRKINQPVATPHTAADVPGPTAVGPVADPTQPRPGIGIAKADAAAPTVAMTAGAEPKTATSPLVANLQTARASAAQPQVVNAPATQPSRTPRQAAAAVDATALGESTSPTAVAQQADAPLVPAAATVGRTASSSNSPAPARPEFAGEALSAPPSNVAGAQIARATASAVPSINPQAPAGPQIGRAQRTAAREASPVAIDSPALAIGVPQGTSGGGSQAGDAGPAGVQPGVGTAIAKGSGGLDGVGGGPGSGPGGGLPGDGTGGGTVGIAATRATTGQGEPAGPTGLSGAGGAAAMGRATAGATIPTGTLAADQIDAGNTGGAKQLSNIEAPAGSGPARADPGLPVGLGPGAGGPGGGIAGSGTGSGTGGSGTGSAGTGGGVGAAAGSGGPAGGGPTVVASLGSGAGAGRLAGGGDPTVKTILPGGGLARSPTAGAAAIALGTDAVAAAAEAPAGEGGGAPGATLSVNTAGTAVARTAASGEVPGAAVASVPQAGGTAVQLSSAPIARAASGGGGPGSPVPSLGGGGSRQLGRTPGQAFTADTKADVVQLPSGPVPGDEPSGAAAQVAGSSQPGGGVVGQANTGPVGAAAGEVVIDLSTPGSVGTGIGTRKSEAAAEQGPTIAGTGIGPLKKLTVVGAPAGVVAAADVPVVPGAGGAGSGQGAPVATELALGGEVGGLGRRAGGLPVNVNAPLGPGGLGSDVTPDVGSLSRRAQRDSEVVHAGTARFIGRKIGGPLAIDGKAKDPSAAFATRGGNRRRKGGGPGALTEHTEWSIEAGLDFLARHQAPDGSWSLHRFGAGRPGYEKETASMHSDTAATGLALLAFLGAGYDHFDDQYKHELKSAVDWLVKNQKANGDLYVSEDAESNKSAWFYSHGIATIALCEAYGMTGDEALREPAQKAIDFIVASQDKKLGGWRYVPQFAADTSVSGWQLMALKSGELAGLKVPAETYQHVKKWLASAQASPADASQYVYNPAAPNTATMRHGRLPSKSMTAVGLLMRLYVGSNRNDPQMVQGAEHLLKNLPAMGTAAQSGRDTYYWYYATQVMFHMKGKYWQAWNERLHPLLVDRQVQSGPMAGSWDPTGPIPDRWGPHGGRIYVTTLNLLSLEVYYRHLPLYESTAQ